MTTHAEIRGSIPMRVLLQSVTGILPSNLLWKKLFQNKPQEVWPPFRSPLPHLYFSMSHAQTGRYRESPIWQNTASPSLDPRLLMFLPGWTRNHDGHLKQQVWKAAPRLLWLAFLPVTQATLRPIMFPSSKGHQSPPGMDPRNERMPTLHCRSKLHSPLPCWVPFRSQ